MAEDSVELPARPLASIQSILRDKAIENSQISVRLAVAKGQNYTGGIYRVAVTSNRDGQDVTLKYIVKVASSGESSRDVLPLALMYKREVIYYTELFPIYNQLQEEAGIAVKDQLKSAACLHAETDVFNEFIVFEDLKESSFFPVDRAVGADYDHARCVLVAYGKLHALSFVFKKKLPEKFKCFTELCTEIMFDIGDWFINYNATIFKKAGAALTDEKHKAILKRYEYTVVNLAKDSLGVDEFSVLSHSDCWATNMLFRYENKKPVQTCLLDFQIARYGPPTADILHYIFSSTRQALRKEYYEDLLKDYHDSMKNHLKAFGYDIDEIYPWTRLKEELVKLAIYGLICGITVPMVALAEEETIPSSDDFSDFENSSLSKSDCSDAYKEHIRGVLEDFITFGSVE